MKTNLNRAKLILNKMTLAEKLTAVYGIVFLIPSIVVVIKSM